MEIKTNKRNKNKAWVPGFRFKTEGGNLRIDTPLFGFLFMGSSDVGNRLFQLEYKRNYNRKRSEPKFKSALKFITGSKSIQRVDLMFKPVMVPREPCWYVFDKVYTISKLRANAKFWDISKQDGQPHSLLSDHTPA